jgi:hypothetical protein
VPGGALRPEKILRRCGALQLRPASLDVLYVALYIRSLCLFDGQMTMAETKTLTHLYLEPSTKVALQSKAKAAGVSLAEEARRAIDAWLNAGASKHDAVSTTNGADGTQQLGRVAQQLATTADRFDALLSQMETKPKIKAPRAQNKSSGA